MESLYYLVSLVVQEAASGTSGTTQEASGQTGSPFSLIFLFVILFGIMYVFLILPQKQRDKRHRAMLSQLKKNDRVVTAGGMHGIVVAVKDDTVILKVDDDKDVKVTFNVGSVTQVVPKQSPQEQQEEGK